MKKTQISFDIELDENKIPEKLTGQLMMVELKTRNQKQCFYQCGIMNHKKH